MGRAIPKLKDIALEAGVSQAAASLILRDAGRFSDETRAKVKRIAEEMGWRQNLLVKGIQTGKTQTVGVLAPPYDSFWSAILSGIQRELIDQKYIPITLWGSLALYTKGEPELNGEAREYNYKEGVDLINTLVDRRIEGLILWPEIARVYSDQFFKLIDRGLPVVLIDHEYPADKNADSVFTDEEHGSREVAEHLVGLGHRNIAYLGEATTEARRWQLLRRTYFKETLARYSDVVYSEYRMDPKERDAKRLAREILGREDRPTAIFCSTDHDALDVYWVAGEMGLRIPDDLSVVGYADLDFAVGMSPPLTTVRQQPFEIGHAASRLLLDRIARKGAFPESKSVKILSELVVRESTRAIQGS
ncbi:MAG: LacI family DNA-binding transcriptional regulator [Verrucomicrobiota bacterium]